MKKIQCLIIAVFIAATAFSQETGKQSEELSSDWVVVSIPARTTTTATAKPSSSRNTSTAKRNTSTQTTTSAAPKPATPKPNPSRSNTTPKTTDEFSKTNQEIKRFKKNR